MCVSVYISFSLKFFRITMISSEKEQAMRTFRWAAEQKMCTFHVILCALLLLAALSKMSEWDSSIWDSETVSVNVKLMLRLRRDKKKSTHKNYVKERETRPKMPMKFKKHEIKWKSLLCRKINCQLIVLLRSNASKQQSLIYSINGYKVKMEKKNLKWTTTTCEEGKQKIKTPKKKRNSKQQVGKRISIFAKFLITNCLLFIHIHLSSSSLYFYAFWLTLPLLNSSSWKEFICFFLQKMMKTMKIKMWSGGRRSLSISSKFFHKFFLIWRK